MATGFNFLSKIRVTSTCWEWIGAHSSSGYGAISFRKEKEKLTVSAHRFSWEYYFGPITGGLFVLHRCDNRSCVRPDHLFLGTQGDNCRDRQSKGRGRDQWGHKNHMYKHGKYSTCQGHQFKLLQP